ncbi:MAG: S41 family peptidase, partial [Phycisphaerales bacterium]|nr:S41 family peptidase [Phycisphaerales bacterium]
PLEDSPAYRAGVMANDRVTAIDGQSTFNKNVNECIELLTGKPGDPVTITVERAGQTLDITIKRAQIVTPTIKGVHRVDDKWDFWIDPERKIAYVRMTQFTAGAVQDFERAIRPLVDSGLQGLVLDLRFNPGGLLPAAIDMADLFLKDGLIVSTRGRARPEQKVFARPDRTLPDFPMVALINRQSASAAEILAGALHDHGRAVALGERTFGKGSVQSVVALPSGAGQLKITEAHYFLASGRKIHRSDDSVEWGVDPTPGFYVPMTDAEYREMLTIRRQEEIIRPRSEDETKNAQWSDPEWILGHLKDQQLAAAVRALSHRIDSGDWKPTGQALPENGVSLAELQRAEGIRERMARELMRLDRQIEALAAGAGANAPQHTTLLPDADLTGGTVKIYDADGNEVGELRITGPQLGSWLEGGPLEPAKKADE